MNVISTIQGLGLRCKKFTAALDPLTVLNGLMDYYAQTSGTQTTIPTNDTSNTYLGAWTLSGAPSNGSTQSGRMFRNFSQSNTSVYGSYPGISNYALWLQQTAALTFSISQPINFPSVAPYNISVWAGPRQLYYNSTQSLKVYIDDVQVIPTITFSTGGTTTPWAQYICTYNNTSAGNKVLKLTWTNTASNDSAIVVTGIQTTTFVPRFNQSLTQKGTSQKGWGFSSMSASGQYQIVGGYQLAGSAQYLQISSDYGSTFGTTNITGSRLSVWCSDDAGLMIDVTTAGLYTSSNQGSSWSVNSSVSTGTIGEMMFYTANGGSGQYQAYVLWTNTKIYVSTDYGSSFTARGTQLTNGYVSISMSSTGQYMVALGSNNVMYYSSNYGTSWSASGWSCPGTYQPYFVTMSSSGQYVSLVGKPSTSGGTQYVYRSSNYGSTYTVNTSFPTTYWMILWGCCMSLTGQYQVCCGYLAGQGTHTDGRGYYSTDYGANWTLCSAYPNNSYGSCSMSANGQYLALSSYYDSTGYYYALMT